MVGTVTTYFLRYDSIPLPQIVRDLYRGNSERVVLRRLSARSSLSTAPSKHSITSRSIFINILIELKKASSMNYLLASIIKLHQ